MQKRVWCIQNCRELTFLILWWPSWLMYKRIQGGHHNTHTCIKMNIPCLRIGLRYFLMVLTPVFFALFLASINNWIIDIGLSEPDVLKELNSSSVTKPNCKIIKLLLVKYTSIFKTFLGYMYFQNRTWENTNSLYIRLWHVKLYIDDTQS